jgi:hypothetical protein
MKTFNITRTDNPTSRKALGVTVLHECDIWGCIQKFPDWPPGVRTANGTALCHYLQLYRYFMSQV